jgi:hypothetical protein
VDNYYNRSHRNRDLLTGGQGGGSGSSSSGSGYRRVFKRNNNTFEDSDEEDVGLFEQRQVKIIHEDFVTEFDDDFGLESNQP